VVVLAPKQGDSPWNSRVATVNPKED
jgi:hypothetical protein